MHTVHEKAGFCRARHSGRSHSFKIFISTFVSFSTVLGTDHILKIPIRGWALRRPVLGSGSFSVVRARAPSVWIGSYGVPVMWNALTKWNPETLTHQNEGSRCRPQPSHYDDAWTWHLWGQKMFTEYLSQRSAGARGCAQWWGLVCGDLSARLHPQHENQQCYTRGNNHMPHNSHLFMHTGQACLFYVIK